METVGKIDELAIFLMAVRFGHEVGQPTDVTDEMIVEMAIDGVFESGFYVLQEYERGLRGIENEQDCPELYLDLISSLAYGTVPKRDLKEWPPISQVPLGEQIIKSHSDLLGPHFSPYLQKCFDAASKDYAEYAVPPNSECYIEEEIPFWLTQAFNVAPTKKTGKKRDLERDAEALDGIHRIWLALAVPHKGRKSKLEDHLRSYSSGDLPISIGQLIGLRGHPQSVLICARHNNRSVESLLAEFALNLVRSVERAEATVSGPARIRRMAAANIFAACQDFNIKQVEALINSDEVSEADQRGLRERRESLSADSSDSFRSNNKSGNATGFERLYRNHRNKLPDTRSALRQFYRSKEESLELLLEYEEPEIQQALEIVASLGVNNQYRKILQTLERQSPKCYERVWRDFIWPQFEAALAQTVKTRGSATTVT